MRVKTFTELPTTLDAYGALTDEAGTQTFKLKVVEVRDTVAISRIQGINDRNAAEKLKGQVLYLRRTSLPEPDKEEYFHADLIGLEVEMEGLAVGVVNALYNFGAGDLIEISLTAGGPPIVLPFTKSAVPVIDLSKGCLEINPPSGLWVSRNIAKEEK